MTLGAKAPAADAARVLLIGAEDFISSRQVEPVRQKTHAHRRVDREGDFLGGRADERTHERARVDERLIAGEGLTVRLEVRPVGKIVFELTEAVGRASTTSRGEPPSVP